MSTRSYEKHNVERQSQNKRVHSVLFHVYIVQKQANESLLERQGKSEGVAIRREHGGTSGG